jgi:hypothetical protein
MRVRGEDMVFWTINDNLLLSDPVPVEQAYPEFHGERPVVIGYGSLDPHRAIPMSAVESWQGLQQEANDAANLRQDHIKQAVSPPAKVKRGRKIDYTAVQRRGQSGIITVQEMDDIEWAEIPPIPSSSYEEDNQRNADFDDLAGVFNSGSVQTNKALNETVGGMRLMSGDANSIADFDLEVFVETYAEPVLFQLMRLEEFYETDEKVLQIAGHRAKLWQKFGTDAITDEMLLAETTITIKVGVGANNDPQSRLNNFMMANGAAQQALMPFVQGGMLKIIPNGEEIANTIFSAAGIKDGAERFYQIVPQDPSQQPNPQMLEAQNKAQDLQIKDKKVKADSMLKAVDLQQRGKQATLSFEDARQQRIADMVKEQMRSKAEITRATLEAHHDATSLGREHAHDRNMHADGVMGDLIKHVMMPPPPPKAPGEGAAD